MELNHKKNFDIIFKTILFLSMRKINIFIIIVHIIFISERFGEFDGCLIINI